MPSIKPEVPVVDLSGVSAGEPLPVDLLELITRVADAAFDLGAGESTAPQLEDELEEEQEKLIAAVQSYVGSAVQTAREEALEDAAKECGGFGRFYEQDHDYYRGAKWALETAADRIRQFYRGIPDAEPSDA